MINTGNPRLPAANPSQAGVVNTLSGVPTDFIGGDNSTHPLPAGIAPTAHAATHETGGSDAIPLDTLGAPTDITTLSVSNSAHGLVPKAPNNVWNIFNGNGAWAESSSGYASRYLYQHHCDRPLSAAEASAVSGTGALIQPVTGNPGQPGLYTIASGTTASSYSSRNSNSVPDFSLNLFNKLAFRAVLRTAGVLPTGATGSTTYGRFSAGFQDTVNAFLGTGAQNGVEWYYDGSVSTWNILLSKGGLVSQYTGTTTVTINTWYDLRIYWDANGLQFRSGYWSGNLPPTLLPGGPFTPTTMPLPSTPLYWTVSSMNGVSGVTAHTIYLDLIEIVGEYTAVPGSYIGDQLILNP